MKVLFLIPAPLNISPGQRFRFEHYLPLLEKQGIDYTVQSFWSVLAWKNLFHKGHLLSKSFGLLSGMMRRVFMLFTLFKFDYIFIYREVAPIGPPVFEWIISKIWRKKIIYDFDDAIWLRISSSANPKAELIKCSWKVKYICKYSKIVSVGNNFLANYASTFNKKIQVIPTVVDTEKVHRGLKNQNDVPFTIGWTGTFTNFYHLAIISEAINKLKEKYSINYLIISNKDPQLKNVEYSYKQWEFETEIADLLQINIGVMPLYYSEFALGKCGFKAIQFMSLGIPVVVSPVGANSEVVKNNETGFWANSQEEWFYYLEKLIVNKELRIKMGQNSQKFIIENYSVQATKELFLGLFQN
jgi:glycosyltransferase involved in cell wall biosynthesis